MLRSQSASASGHEFDAEEFYVLLPGVTNLDWLKVCLCLFWGLASGPVVLGMRLSALLHQGAEFTTPRVYVSVELHSYITVLTALPLTGQ